MGTCLSNDELLGLVAETLSQERRTQVEAHVAECESCRHRLEELCRRQLAAHEAEDRDHASPRPGRAVETVAAPRTPVSPEDTELAAGPTGPPRDSIQGYEILSEIHRGGQGVVYKAVQKSTKRTVAVKVLLQGPYASERQRRRFEREIDLVAGLKHPNIVTVYDSGVTRDGRHYCAMEYVHGQPLDGYLLTHDLDIDGRLRLLAKVCRAVSYAHQHGVIHRDIKPGNVLVDSDGEPHVLDFGLAKTARPDFTGDGTPMTVTGEFMGTLAYASPEQAKGDPSTVDVRSDVYSLGVILYRVLAGAEPYAFSTDIGEMLRRITEFEPPKPSTVNPGLGDDIDTVVLKALAKDRERRYQSAGELTQDIERLLAGLPVEAKRDSLGYVLRTRTRRYVFRHLAVSIAAAVLVAVVLAERVVTPLIVRTPAYRYLSRLVTTYAAPIEPITAFEHVRLVRLGDETDVEAIAEREGLVGVTVENGRSLRRLHGRMMEKLVGTGIGVLVWDITFRAPPTEFDEDFARGALALRDDGADVVVAVKDGWWDRGPPKISPVIEPVVRTGAVTANCGSSGPWYVWLFVDRPRQKSAVSLALQALASYRLAGCEVQIAGHAAGHELTLSYWAPGIAGQGSGPLAHFSNRVVVTEYRSPPRDASDIGMQRGDKVAYSLLHMPRNAVLEASTIDYTRVFSAGPEELQQLLGDKIVIVGDMRKDTDLHGHPDGRSLRGCHAHAAGIDAILRGVSVGAPTDRVALLMTSAAAFLGLFIAALAPAQPFRRGAVLVVLALVAVLACLFAYREFRYLVIPVAQVFAVVVCCELAAAAIRVGRRRHPSHA